MNRTLLSMVYSIAFTVIIGVLMVAALVLGYDEIHHILIVVGVGAIISVPVAIVIDKKMEKMKDH